MEFLKKHHIPKHSVKLIEIWEQMFIWQRLPHIYLNSMRNEMLFYHQRNDNTVSNIVAAKTTARRYSRAL